MTSPEVREKNTPHRKPASIKFLLFPFGLLYRMWSLSLRIKYVPGDGCLDMQEWKGPLTIILWHNRLFVAGEWHRRFRKKRKCYGLISARNDGAWLEIFYGWIGIRAIRGSRNRRGFEATRQLIRVVKEGNDVGITPDGSRGPKYVAKSGALVVAKSSRSTVALLSFTYSWAFRLKSWDEFVVPLPFSSITAKSQLLHYDTLFKGRTIEEATQVVETSLKKLTDDPD